MLLAVLLAGCREEQLEAGPTQSGPTEQAGDPRAYRLGFSAVPVELTDTSYTAAFDLAAEFGEVLLVQRPPSWADFLPGADISNGTRQAAKNEREAVSARGLKLFVALDPFDPAARDRLAALPGGYEDRGFEDPRLQQAFIAEATFIALNERPAYLALGMEVNAVYERNPSLYEQFVAVYRAAYEAVKDVSPETQVFVTFQYEQLLGVVPWEPPHTPRWELLGAYEERIDLFAITSYPSFAYPVARKVPPLYYRQIQDHTSLPIAFAAVGYASAPGREGLNSSTPAEQRRFLQRLLQDADELGAELLVWFAGRDPAFAATPPYDLLTSIGLRSATDDMKEAWLVWEAAARRPYDPAAAAALRPVATLETPASATASATATATAAAPVAGG